MENALKMKISDLNWFSQASFPDNTYGVDSGGDPTVIPDLTFEQFKVRFSARCNSFFSHFPGQCHKLKISNFFIYRKLSIL